MLTLLLTSLHFTATQYTTINTYNITAIVVDNYVWLVVEFLTCVKVVTFVSHIASTCSVHWYTNTILVTHFPPITCISEKSQILGRGLHMFLTQQMALCVQSLPQVMH